MWWHHEATELHLRSNRSNNVSKPCTKTQIAGDSINEFWVEPISSPLQMTENMKQEPIYTDIGTKNKVDPIPITKPELIKQPVAKWNNHWQVPT